MNDKPTGNLEELFRHHLAEADVPPRSMLWEQIDNSLLVAQNETFRRRLTATRWVAAASFLLATLAGTGWWAQHETVVADRIAVNRIDVGTDSQTVTLRGTEATGQSQLNTASQDGTSSTDANNVAMAARTTTATPMGKEAAVSVARLDMADKTQQAANNLAAASTRLEAKPSPLHNAVSMVRTGPNGASVVCTGRNGGEMTGRLGLSRAANTQFNALAKSVAGYASATTAATRAAYSGQAPATTADLALGNNSLDVASPATSNSFDWLAARPVTLQNTLLATNLPVGLTALSLPANTETTVVPMARKWQFGVSYAATAFNPNINFSRAGGTADFDYNPALGANSPALTEKAATEYQAQLQSGFSQRLALHATRRVGGHWAVSTGLEVAQQTATSATSMVFLGEQVPDLGQQNSGELRTTSFRYRTAGVPVELRYSNSVKRGWSGYGRVGAVVSTLFTVRGEVEGEPEATRTYSLRSSNDAYRKVLTNVRGGAGVQFRPASGPWAFTLGPTAEVGLLSLNAHPAQDFLHQSRAYSFGLEAGVEFGR